MEKKAADVRKKMPDVHRFFGFLRTFPAGKRFPALVVAVIVSISLFWIAVSFRETPPPDTHYNPQRLKEIEESIYSLGPRVTGTEAEKKAASIVAEHFERAGLSNVRVVEYPLMCYEIYSVKMSIDVYGPLGVMKQETVEVSHPGDVVAQAYSGSAEGSFDVVWVGDGNEEDYNGVDVEGKIALVTNKNEGSLTQKWITADEKGAAALIIINEIYNPDDGYKPIGFSAAVEDERGHLIPAVVKYPSLDIPSLMVSKSIGEKLRDGRVVVSLSVKTFVGMRSVSVAEGEIPGKERGFILVQAHHDTVYTSPGAVDNAAGTAQAVEMAYLLGKTHPKHTIRITTVGGEEGGLLGSYSYFLDHEEEIRKEMLIDVNLDSAMVTKPGGRINLYFSDEKYMEVGNASVRWYFGNYPEENGSASFHVYEKKVLSGHDVATYEKEGLRGVTAVGVDKVFPYHRPGDTIDKVDYPSMGAVASIFSNMVWRIE